MKKHVWKRIGRELWDTTKDVAKKVGPRLKRGNEQFMDDLSRIDLSRYVEKKRRR